MKGLLGWFQGGTGAHPCLLAPALSACLALAAQGPAPERWRLEVPARRIVWDLTREARLPHSDRIEMSGRRVAGIVSYGADGEGNLRLERTCVWPTLRVAPNDTHASLMVQFQRNRPPLWLNGRNQPLQGSDPSSFEPEVRVGGEACTRERLERVIFQDGILRLETRLKGDLGLVREIFPSREGRAMLERWTLRNRGTKPILAGVGAFHRAASLPFSYVDKGFQLPGQSAPAPVVREGDYRIAVDCEGVPPRNLQPGESVSVGVAFHAGLQAEPEAAFAFDRERESRAAFARELQRSLRFECPEPELETLFDFSKLRASESIIETAHGPMHAPGGGSYYAAMWTNDTVEYVAPFYPFAGHGKGNEATLNALCHYERYVNPEFSPLPVSIIAEGTDTWTVHTRLADGRRVAADRGDAAMLAFGGSRFLLALGDREEARRHWPLVQWCLEYCERRKGPEGVIASEFDELEGRFSAGTYNLNTNLLSYGGLRSAGDLAEELGDAATAALYRRRAEALGKAVERYFGTDVQGFRTYRYHDGLDTLRAWICIPLCMGMTERSEGTLQALFSPKLWTADGLLTAQGSTTFWDRATLYALRGAFNAGATEQALEHLRLLTHKRLLGDHVPYVVEAYPEGEGRHLSAESALFARVITEGLFGITPTGFRRFSLSPRLPKAWPRMNLRKVRAFGQCFDVEVTRAGASHCRVRVHRGGRVVASQRLPDGGAFTVTLPSLQEHP